MHVRLLAMGLGCLAGIAMPVLGQETGAGTAPRTIVFPFAPPTGQVLHYRVTKTGAGAHSPPEVILDQQLAFRSVTDGYSLTIKTNSLAIGGRTVFPRDAGHVPMPVPDMISLSTPVTIALAPSGHAIAIQDWDKLRESIRLIPDRISQSAAPSVQSRVREAVSDAIQPILQLDDRAAWTFVAAEWPPVLTFGGAPMELDTPMKVESVHYLLDGAVPVHLVHDVIVTQRADGGFTLEETQRPDIADFAAAITKFYDQLAKTMSPEALAARRANEAGLSEDVVRSATTHIDVDQNGVLQSGFWEVKYQKPDGTITNSNKVLFEKLTDTPTAGTSH